MMWHTHTWREVGRVFTDPRNFSSKGLEMSERMAERLLFGITIIGLECSICGDWKSVEMLGKHAKEQAHD